VRVAVVVGVAVGVGVSLGVAVAVSDGVAVAVAVGVWLAVCVAVGVCVAVFVGEEVAVRVGVWVAVVVTVSVGVSVGVGVEVGVRVRQAPVGPSQTADATKVQPVMPSMQSPGTGGGAQAATPHWQQSCATARSAYPRRTDRRNSSRISAARRFDLPHGAGSLERAG